MFGGGGPDPRLEGKADAFFGTRPSTYRNSESSFTILSGAPNR